MLDIKYVRENRDLVKENLKKRFQEGKIPLVDELLDKDSSWRSIKKEIDELRSSRNKLSQQVNDLKKAGQDISETLAKVKDIPKQIAQKEDEAEKLTNRITEILMDLPNMLHESVPIGRDDKENVPGKEINEKRKFDFELKNHAELAENLNVGDFETSSDITGQGFYILKNELALLNQALIRYAQDFMYKKGYSYIETPLMIREKIVNGVMSFTEKDSMMYKLEGEDLYLIGTSEHSLIGMFMNKTIKEEDLPLKIYSYSMCFRKEGGAHGLDEKGLFRTHQFNKVEQIIISKPEDSYNYYDELLNNTLELFKALDLPLRTIECCSGDLAGLKAKSEDVEVFSPRRDAFIEVASCSNLTDNQARRLNIRAVDKHGNRYYPHTLNDTAIATSRVLVAILENNQQADGSVLIPKVLQPYMHNITVIKR